MMKNLAFAGRKNSGKSEAIKMLSHEYTNVKFAGPIKAMLAALLEYRGVPYSSIQRMVDGNLKDTPSGMWCGKTPRDIQKGLGDFFRSIDPDFFINCFDDACDHIDGNITCDDVRYPNENEHLACKGFKQARMNRDTNSSDTHSSERYIDDLTVDFEIDNNGSLEYLELQVREFEE